MSAVPPSATPHQPARSAPLADALEAAARLMAAVLEGRNLDHAVAAAGLAGPTRAAAMDLAFSSLRAYGRGDFVLGRLMTKPLADPMVRGLLLAALNRLETRPEDAHTTVDQAVTAASRLAEGRFKGLVNGVLRNFLRQRDSLLAAAQADPVARDGHPAWWRAHLKRDHPHHWPAILAAGNQHPPMALRLNLSRIASADFSQQLSTAAIPLRRSEGATLWLERPIAVDRLPGFAEGWVSVQDAGAQQAARLLDLVAGQRVLDACAAPGGKSAHILELCPVHLTAIDIDGERAERIRQTLARLGLAANIKVADVRHRNDWWDGQPFDRILADAPCSASGVARRHPDIKWLRREADIVKFARLQREILDSLWPALAPGGKLLYATCSVFVEENQLQVKDFLTRHRDARRVPISGLDDLQLLPDADHDGFYYALLQKA